VGVEQANELDETLLGGGHLPCCEELAGVVDDRDREGVFVGVYSGEHCCHLFFDVTAGSATHKHSGATTSLSRNPVQSLYRASSPTVTATGRQPSSRASPSPVGSKRLSLPDDVAGPGTAPARIEHSRMQRGVFDSEL
jgi:hypothetical protein